MRLSTKYLRAQGSKEYDMAASPNNDAPSPDVTWQGLNHLALITNDMDTTVRFWHGVMGAPLVATIGTPTFRHYFFKFGESSSVAFFQYTGHESKMIAKPA